MAFASTFKGKDRVAPPASPPFDFSVPTLTPDTDMSSDSDTPRKPKTPSKARAKKARKTLQKTLSAATPNSSSLRPAKDILSRIRHDPALNDDDFIVGYQDRHADVMEMPVAMWKGSGDVTEDEFIPQHRILYFRMKENEARVWDRKARVDLLFGSGNGTRDRQEQMMKKKGSGEVEKTSRQNEQVEKEVHGASDEIDQPEPLEEAGSKSDKNEEVDPEYEDAVASLLM